MCTGLQVLQWLSQLLTLCGSVLGRNYGTRGWGRAGKADSLPNVLSPLAHSRA